MKKHYELVSYFFLFLLQDDNLFIQPKSSQEFYEHFSFQCYSKAVEWLHHYKYSE